MNETFPSSHSTALPSLEPARWIWYPSQHALPCTFVLFRRTINLTSPVRRATGWISADSRYLLSVNDQRAQWGPSPCDPRWVEADPLHLTPVLHEGRNVLAATVCYFGHGEGTWVMGKPGFLFRLEIETEDGRSQLIVSDDTWKAHLCRAWPPGQHKRFFVRALQEDFDARRYPYGWTTVSFEPNIDWLDAMVLEGSPNQPAVCTRQLEHLWGIEGDRSICHMRPRATAMLREVDVPVSKLTEQFRLSWRRPIVEYFESLTPNAFDAEAIELAEPIGPAAYRIAMHEENQSAVLTFELPEQVVGWPKFTVEAPAGTQIELLMHEAHQPGTDVLINTHFQSWARFTCREGTNPFETFDYESCRWLQLNIHGPEGQVVVRDVGVRRRIFPWPNGPHMTCGEPALQKLIDASINTLHNSCQETCVDGMGRERQQYSGDCGHQLHALYQVFGDTTLPARFVTTFSQGMTPEGYFLDCWPAYDRLVRLMERAIDMAWWGPLLDHGIGFNFDCWHHYLYTGDRDALTESYPRLLKFFNYLRTIRDEHDLLRVEGLGTPCVWLDHVAYQQQRHKQCAFNLYAAAMMKHALAPLCRVFGDDDRADKVIAFGRLLQEATIRRFWCRDRKLFVANLPWLKEEDALRMCDRSLATAVLFDQCPDDATSAIERVLIDCPDEMGLSYPANAGWRLWALARIGRGDVVLNELRNRWATMPSVALNNTIQEDWEARPDSGSQWSHCAVVPLYILNMSIAGIRPTAPGFARCEIRPQLADLDRLELTHHTICGPIGFASEGLMGNRRLKLTLPPECDAELIVHRDESLALEAMDAPASAGCRRYRLPAGETTAVLKHT